ncbi:ATP-binding cassette domain-containing protein [bacterium 210820-DFI.6.37]|nr:ATP-binding cassette domain-containing protein [bacterium 210820-DFI.6.37]
MTENTEIFRLEHVSKVFENKNGRVTAVDDVSLSIREGEIFGIIGMSGAGKSTLVRTLNRLEEVTKGKVIFDGRVLGELPDKELRQVRRSIAMIFQSFNLLMQKTVLENVMLPMKIAKIPKKKQKEKAMEMLKIVGLEKRAKAYPAQLSGGQRQRVAIARALSMDPKVLLCDEATSALDPKITGEILELLKEINQKMKLTIVIITHEMSVVEKICHRVGIVDHGKLVELGSVKEIFARPKTDAAKHLVFPAKQDLNLFDRTDKRCIRLVFDGRAANESLIANMVQDTGEKVNILCADTKSVGGIGFGQMIVELPEKPESAERVLEYFKEAAIPVTEVTSL